MNPRGHDCVVWGMSTAPSMCTGPIVPGDYEGIAQTKSPEGRNTNRALSYLKEFLLLNLPSSNLYSLFSLRFFFELGVNLREGVIFAGCVPYLFHGGKSLEYFDETIFAHEDVAILSSLIENFFFAGE